MKRNKEEIEAAFNQIYHPIMQDEYDFELKIFKSGVEFADNNPESSFTPISEGMPTEDGDYVVIIGDDDMEYKELCSYIKGRKKFRCWSYYNDKEMTYGKKDVKAWMKV